MIDELILNLAGKGILVHVQDGELIVNAPKGVLDKDWIDILKQQKTALIEYLCGQERSDASQFDRIRPAPLQTSYPLSSGQRRLWVLSHLGNGSVAYNMSGSYIFSGMLDRIALEDSINKIIDRHESLRTVFGENDRGELQQYILPAETSKLKIGHYDLRDEQDRYGKVQQLIEQLSGMLFDLSSGPLIRACIYRLADDKWIFTYALHHIISDGWSMDVLINELLQLYTAATTGIHRQLTPLHLQYKDYAVWQQEQLSGDALQGHKKYWLSILDEELPVLDLPADKARPAVRTYHGGAVRRMINKETASSLKSLSQDNGATFFIGLLAAVNALLYRYTGQTDILIGTPIAGRDHADLEDQIGCYLNTLVLRTEIQGGACYRDLLKDVRQLTLEAFKHKEFPFDELVEALHLRSETGRNRLFDVMVELRDKFIENKEETGAFGNINVEGYEEQTAVYSKFDLTFFFTDSGEGLALLIEYNTDIFNEDRIAGMAAHLEQLLASIVKDPGLPVDQLAYLSSEEREQVLYGFNDTEATYSDKETVLSLFEKYAVSEPDTIALTYDRNAISYGDLDSKAGRLADYLVHTHKIGQNDLVGIMLDRSEAAIISMLGIMKTGAAYVPIDPEYPRTRKEYICKNTGLKVLITQHGHLASLGTCEAAILEETAFSDIIHSPVAYARLAAPRQDQLVYVIYTSGSTGEPKGCAITHGNLYNYIQWSNDNFFTRMDRPYFGLFTSLAFDLTVTTIYCPLTMGGKLHLYGPDEPLTDALLHSFSTGSGINSAKITPSHIILLEDMAALSPDMSCAVVGGEEMTGKHVRILKSINPSMRVFNEYGPTEATVGCTIEELTEESPFLIGRPLANMRIYILDDNNQPCPVGIPGNMYISGKGVSTGYLDEDLSKLKFLPNPFIKGDRMYKTGDWGRWHPNGKLEFMGRRDEQVKIRGYRIELGEIETAIKKNAAVREAVVLAKKDEEGVKNLIAFYVPAKEDGRREEGITQEIEPIEESLRKLLPFYMIPQRFIAVDRIPLTANGKINRKALLELHSAEVERQRPYIAPRTHIEKRMSPIWIDVLNFDQVSIDDNFFELGGHSLKAMRLMAKIRKEFNVTLGLDTLFLYSTIRSLAGQVEITEWASGETADLEHITNEEKFLL